MDFLFWDKYYKYSIKQLDFFVIFVSVQNVKKKYIDNIRPPKAPERSEGPAVQTQWGCGGNPHIKERKSSLIKLYLFTTVA